MLTRIKTLANEGVDFAFETTLASRSFATWIEKWKSRGYHVHLIFLWLRSVELAISRVADRVRMGGHSISKEVIQRRYNAGLRNFFKLYSSNVTSWKIYDNSDTNDFSLIASKMKNKANISNEEIWKNLVEKYDG